MSPGEGPLRYFAYGSNMPRARLAERLGEVLTLGAAVLRFHELRFHKRGADGSGKCDVLTVSAQHAVVHGALFALETRQFERLHAFEGAGYECVPVEVEQSGRFVRAWTYRALAAYHAPLLRPFDWYLALVLAGAEEHGLPADYRASLAQVPSVADVDTARASYHLGLINRPRAGGDADPVPAAIGVDPSSGAP